MTTFIELSSILLNGLVGSKLESFDINEKTGKVMLYFSNKEVITIDHHDNIGGLFKPYNKNT